MASYDDTVLEAVAMAELYASELSLSQEAADAVVAYGDIGLLGVAVSSAVMAGTSVANAAQGVSTADTLTVMDVAELLNTVGSQLSDGVSVGSTVTGILSLSRTAAEIAQLSTSLSATGSTYNIEIVQNLSASATYVISYLASVADAVTPTADVSAMLYKISKCLDIVRASSTLGTSLAAANVVTLLVAVQDALYSGHGADASENVVITADEVSKALGVIQMLESIAVAGVVGNTVAIRFNVPETVAFNADLSSAAVMQGLLDEGVSFQISFGGDDLSWAGYVMNTRNFAVTQYTNYPFNSFAKIGASYYGANQSGLYLLEGDSDNGAAIAAQVMLGKTNFDTQKRGAVRDAWLGLRADGDIYLKVVTDDDHAQWYRTRTYTDGLDRVRLKMSRGITSNFWQFGIENIDGADFELSEIELFHITLSRH